MVVVNSESELIEVINKRIEEQGLECDLNDIDVSRVKDMSGLFSADVLKDFNGDISQWDTSNVFNMRSMFEFSAFTGDISKWNVSRVGDMSYMFSESKFNGDISRWGVSNVRDVYGMFLNSKFSGDIRDWNIDISYVEDMCNMFHNSPLEGREPLWYIIWMRI